MFCTREKNHHFKNFYSTSLTLSSMLFIHSEWKSETATSQHANPSILPHLQLHTWTLWFVIVCKRLACTNKPGFSRPTCFMQYDCTTFFNCLYCRRTSHIYCKQDAYTSSYKERSTCDSVLWPLKFSVKRLMLCNTLQTKTFPESHCTSTPPISVTVPLHLSTTNFCNSPTASQHHQFL